MNDPDQRRERRRAAARAYGAWYRDKIANDPEFAADMAELHRAQGEGLRGYEWTG
jgi:hypothetical protein